MDLYPLHHSKLSLLSGVVVGIRPLGTIPRLAGDTNGCGERIAIRFGHRDARTKVFEVDNIVNRSREDVGEVIAAASELVGLNGVEGTFSTVDTVRVIAVNVGVAIVVNAVSTGIFVNGHWRISRTWNDCILISDLMIPIAVKEEVGWKGNLWCETKGVRGEFVKR